MPKLHIFGDLRSGNCLKVKWTADRLGLAYEWTEVDVMDGTTRSPDFLALNPAGQVPTVVLPDGRPLSQSNAIILHLAEGTDLVPADAYARAKVLEWLFWEQYSHEPYIAVARFHMVFLGKPAQALETRLVKGGRAALGRMQQALAQAEWLVGDGLTVADIGLVAYTRWAHEGGFDLGGYPAVAAWVPRVERALGLASPSPAMEKEKEN